MQSNNNKVPISGSGTAMKPPLLQPKHIPLIGQPLLQTGYPGQQGMYVQNVQYQSTPVGTQPQRSASMALGVYQQPAHLYPGSIVQPTGQLGPRMPGQQSVVPGLQMSFPGPVGLPAQGVISSGLQVSGIQPAMDPSKQVRTPTMIQPKIPVPLNLPQIQPAHGYQPGNCGMPGTGTPISAQLVPSMSSVAVTQIPTPQFLSTPGGIIRSPVSPQFLTPQAHSPQLSPMMPISPALFQVQGNPQSAQSFMPASSSTQFQPALFTFGTQPSSLSTSPMSLTPQNPGGIHAVSPVNVSPQGNILYSPATPGLSPMITIQALDESGIADQPTDLSMKSPREESKKDEKEENEEIIENAETGSTSDLQKLDSPQDEEMLEDDDMSARSSKQSFQESLNLKLKDPATVSTTSSERVSPVEDESPYGSGVADDVFMNIDGNMEKDTCIEKEVKNDEETDEVTVETSDTEFVWEEYLQETGVQAVPPTAFKHVEFSLQSGFVKGMKLEVPNKCSPMTYWVASVIMTCGPLLRLRYDGYEEDSSGDFWCDLATSELHPIGWCAQNGQNLQPPEAIKFKFNDWREFLMTSLTGARTAPSYLLDKTTGYTPIDQLKPGIRLELQDYLNPLEVWIVKIIENIGGRLYLRLDGVESGSRDFWMFYLHYRLHPVGWSQTQEGFSYKPPSSIENEHSEDEWQEVLKIALKENEERALPADVYKDQPEIQPHKFEVGMKVELLHPQLNNHIYPATVCKVFNQNYFQVEIDDLREPGERTVVRVGYHGNQIGVFPITWCQSQGIKLSLPRGWIKPEFSWGEYLTYCNAKAAPDKCFNLSQHDDHEFERGMKLEAVNPSSPNQICASTVTKVAGPLLWIHLDSNVKGMSTYIESVDSFNLFPVGWCESNGYPLKPPRRMSYGKRSHRRMSLLEKKDLHGEDFRSQTYQDVQSGDKEDSWCPKIYFNHRCFSGPFLSKGRIAELPKSVGPGPIDLVMKEVLTLLCSVAYVSSRVLKEIEKDGPANPSMHKQVLKAKYKGKSYRAVVEICKKVSQLEEFCRQVCIKLECCPYLFSPLLVEDNCPENCMQLTKTKIPYTYGYKKKKKLPVGRPPLAQNRQSQERSEPGSENTLKVPGKRGRKRKRFHLIHKKSHSAKPEDENGNEADDGSTNGDARDEGFIDDDRSGEEDEDNRSVTPSKQPGVRKKYQRHIPAPSDIQTRGARLPRYTFERRTHKKILLTHSSPPHKVKPKIELPATRSPPSETKAIYPKLPKNDDLHTDTNPLYWSVDDVIEFLKTTDCSHLARIIKEQEIDGQAFLLLSLATIQDHLDLKLGPAVKLCHQIERVKLVFFEKFAK